MEHTFALGSPALYREWGYVALSRGRQSNRLYVCAGDDHLDDLHHHAPEPDVDPISSLTARLERSRADLSLTDTHAQAHSHLGARWRQARDRFHHPAVARHRELTEQHQKLVNDSRYIAANIQHLTTTLDQTRRGLGRVRQRRDLTRLKSDLAHRQAIAERLDAQIATVQHQLDQLPPAKTIRQIVDDYRSASLDIHQQARRQAQRAETSPPPYLAHAIGTPPDERDTREAWRAAAYAIEQYRIRWSISNPHHALGDEPTHPAARDDHQHAFTAITAARDALERTRSPGRGLSRSLSLGR